MDKCRLARKSNFNVHGTTSAASRTSRDVCFMSDKFATQINHLVTTVRNLQFSRFLINIDNQRGAGSLFVFLKVVAVQ